MSSSHAHAQHVGFSPEKSLVPVQHSSSPSVSTSPSPSASASLSPCPSPSPSHTPFRASLHRTSYTPISIMKKSYAAPKKSLRFVRDSPPSSSGPTAQPPTSDALYDTDARYYYPGVSSPKKPASRLQPRSLDISQASPDKAAAFHAAMAHALALANNALCIPSEKPAPQPITAARSTPIAQPSPQPVLVARSAPAEQSSPSPAIVAPSTPLAQSSPLRTVGLIPPVRDPLPSPTKRASRAAFWLETFYSPDVRIPLTSTPTWSHCTRSAASDATTVLSSPRTNDADGSDASFTDYRLPFAGFTNTVLSAVAGRRFWRMPKGGTRQFVDFLAHEGAMFQSPSPSARHASVASWLRVVPTPLRQSPSPQPSLLRRLSPVPSSLFDSLTASPPAVVDPESPLRFRAPCDLPIASSCFRSQTASSPSCSSASSDDWPFGPHARRASPRARSSPPAAASAFVDEWDDGFLDRLPVDSPSPPSRLRDIPISPLGSEYFRSSIGSPSPVRDLSPAPAPVPVPVPVSPLGSEYFRSSIGSPGPSSPVVARSPSPSPSPARASTDGPYSPGSPSLEESSSWSPGSSPFARPRSPRAPMPSPSLSPSPALVPTPVPIVSRSPSPAPTPAASRSPSPSLSPAPTPVVSRSPSPAPAPTPATSRSPSPAPAPAPDVPRSPVPAEPVEPAAPPVAPSPAPEPPQLSWKIAAGVVAGAFAITCLASHYLF